MCGRYSLTPKRPTLEKRFNAKWAGLLEGPIFNAAPSQGLPVITNQEPDTIQSFSWGLIPFWAKDGLKSRKSINARAETLLEKSSFRSLLSRKRCLVPADGFYEWMKAKTGNMPHRFQLQTEEIFAFAGLWDAWLNKETGELLHTYVIITTEANELVRPLHDRMPVILPPGTEREWLINDLPATEYLDLLRPFPVEAMKRYPVSPLVNDIHHQGPEVLQPASASEDPENGQLGFAF